MATAIRIEGMNGGNFARVVAAPIASGEQVSAGQAVLEVENHKVLQEIESSADGILYHDLQPGDLVRLEVPVAFVARKDEEGPGLINQTRAAKLEAIPDWTDDFSEGTKPDTDAGWPIPVAKATEISVLGRGAGNSLVATLGAAIGPMRRGSSTPNFFQDKVLDLVIYEASRLLSAKKYRILNSRFVSGHIVPHDRLVMGVSFDEGARLTIYSLPDADKLSLAETQDKIAAGLMRYVGRKLTIDEVAGATVTVNDSSAAELNLSVPLLPRDQCIIISLIKDGAGSFSLSISYDHRITEGLTVANFAAELVRRILSYSELPTEPDEATCAFCQRTATLEVAEFRRRGLLRISDEAGKQVWCCVTCWENW